jgi:hypothetical protein
MREEIQRLQKLLLPDLAAAAVVIGFNALWRGPSGNLVLLLAGFLVGLPLLDLDRVLAKAIGTREDVFHLFAIYPVFFVTDFFVVTASGSVFGRGLVISLMLHAALGFTEKFQQRVAFGLLGLICLLAIFG